MHTYTFQFFVCLLSTFNAIPIVRCQVNQEIDDIEDLLAVESNNFDANSNEINPYLVEILPAPEGFGGERLTNSPGVNANSNAINQDGSYAFR